MAAHPKLGDPAFVPRYPPLDLAPIRQRIEERREAAKCLDETKRLIIESDTDMMAELVLAVTNLRVALDIAKDLHLAASTRPASSDGPMQKCFSCNNWTPVSGPAKCASCRRPYPQAAPSADGPCSCTSWPSETHHCANCRERERVNISRSRAASIDDPYAPRGEDE